MNSGKNERSSKFYQNLLTLFLDLATCVYFSVATDSTPYNTIALELSFFEKFILARYHLITFNY